MANSGEKESHSPLARLLLLGRTLRHSRRKATPIAVLRMPRKPLPAQQPLLPFDRVPDETPLSQDHVPSHPEGDPHAVQDDRPRADPAAAGDARPAPQHGLLLPTLEQLASELKTSHEAWKEQLSQARPGSSESQIASEALEIALKELEDCLPSASPPDDSAMLPSTRQWRSSAVTRRPRKGVTRPEAAQLRCLPFRRSPSLHSSPARGLERRHGNQPAGHCKQATGPPEGLPNSPLAIGRCAPGWG